MHLQPNTLLDIAEFGASNPPLANQALYELFEQLKQQTYYPLLIAIDKWNECFPVSEYLSVKYQGTKYHGWIPGYNLSIPRLFCRWDGSSYRRGIKLFIKGLKLLPQAGTVTNDVNLTRCYWGYVPTRYVLLETSHLWSLGITLQICILTALYTIFPRIRCLTTT